MINEITGDLITLAEEGKFDVICQGCNCWHTMESGIAKTIKEKYPEAYEVDLQTVYGVASKLGDISYTRNTPFVIVNCYTQFKYGKEVKVYADYDAIEEALNLVKIKYQGKRIGLPKIGAGLAKGNWETIKQIIKRVFCDPSDDVTIVYWDQNDELNFGHKGLLDINVPSTFSNTSHHYHGKRKCRVCEQHQPVTMMNVYAHSVWCCKGKCHKEFLKIVSRFNDKDDIPVVQASHSEDL